LPVFRVTLLPSRFSNGRKNGSPQEFDRSSILGRFLSPAGVAAERGCDFENGIVWAVLSRFLCSRRSFAADSARATVGCRVGLPRSAPYFAVQPQKRRSRRVVLQSTKCGADVPTRRRRRQGSPVRNIPLSNSDGQGGHQCGMKMGGRRSSAIRYAPVYVIQFSKICEPLLPTPYDENSRFRYCTSNSIHEARALGGIDWWPHLGREQTGDGQYISLHSPTRNLGRSPVECYVATTACGSSTSTAPPNPARRG
jgi:hypothetical protein